MEKHIPEEEKKYKCTECSKTFAKERKLINHQKQHSNLKSFTCDECGKGFSSKSNLQSHIKGIHEKGTEHVCEICAKVFKSRGIYYAHHKRFHSGKDLVKQQCKICNSWLICEMALKRHMKRHHVDSGLHICDICQKQSPTREALRSHKTYTHQIQRTHECNICGKAFKRAMQLKEHMTLHTGAVLYTCCFCPKTFNSNANMYAHRKKNHPDELQEMRKNMINKKKEIY